MSKTSLYKSFLWEGIFYKIDVFQSGADLLKSSNNFDLVFLDIALKGINGIQTGRKIRLKNINTKIIYTTSFTQYCEEAINNVHAFAYLKKPIVINKAEHQLNEFIYNYYKEIDDSVMLKFEIMKDGSIDYKIKHININERTIC